MLVKRTGEGNEPRRAEGKRGMQRGELTRVVTAWLPSSCASHGCWREKT